MGAVGSVLLGVTSAMVGLGATQRMRKENIVKRSRRLAWAVGIGVIGVANGPNANAAVWSNAMTAEVWRQVMNAGMSIFVKEAVWDPAKGLWTRPGQIIAQATGVARDQAYGFHSQYFADGSGGTPYMKTFASVKLAHDSGIAVPNNAAGPFSLMDRNWRFHHVLDQALGVEYFREGNGPTISFGAVDVTGWDVPFYAVFGTYANANGDQGLRATPPKRFYPVTVEYKLSDLAINPISGAIVSTPRGRIERKTTRLDSIGAPTPAVVDLLEYRTEFDSAPVARGAVRRYWALEFNFEALPADSELLSPFWVPTTSEILERGRLLANYLSNSAKWVVRMEEL